MTLKIRKENLISDKQMMDNMKDNVSNLSRKVDSWVREAGSVKLSDGPLSTSMRAEGYVLSNKITDFLVHPLLTNSMSMRLKGMKIKINSELFKTRLGSR